MSRNPAPKYLQVANEVVDSEFATLLTTESMIHVSPNVETFGMTHEFVKAARSGELKAHVIWSTWRIARSFDESQREYDDKYVVEIGLAPFNELEINKQFHLLGPVSFETEHANFEAKFPIKHLKCYTGSVSIKCPPFEILTSMDGILNDRTLGVHKRSIKKLIINDVGYDGLSDQVYVGGFSNLEEVWAPKDSVCVVYCPKLRFVSTVSFEHGVDPCRKLEVIKCSQLPLFETRDVIDFDYFFPNLKRLHYDPDDTLSEYVIEECYKSGKNIILEPYNTDAEFEKSRGY